MKENPASTCKKTTPEQYLFTGLIGLLVTMIVHTVLIFVSTQSFQELSLTMWPFYPTWITFFVIGLGQIRKRAEEE